MGSREKILSAIRQSKPEAVSLETAPYFGSENLSLTVTFQTILQEIGGQCTVIEKLEDLNEQLQQERQRGSLLFNGIEGLADYHLPSMQTTHARDLEATQTVVLKGDLGVAENGAVWVSERNMGHRILPFITEQLILVIEERSIVSTLHDAYEQLTVNQDGYGVFIAGPSKTADIEQSLVIGAHGPIRMQVYIIKK